jgi:transaldolase
MNIQIFADGADLNSITAINKKYPSISGYTTNPSLMAISGITDYANFIDSLVKEIPDKSISFEVLADDPLTQIYQAERIAEYGQNIFVKIPVIDTSGILSSYVIRELIKSGVKINITAVFTEFQINALYEILLDLPANKDNLIVSVFAGRIADTGVDPVSIIKYAKQLLGSKAQILWASTREVYNIYQAEQTGCDIITASPSQIDKYFTLKGKHLGEYSKETVSQFVDDGIASRLSI